MGGRNSAPRNTHGVQDQELSFNTGHSPDGNGHPPPSDAANAMYFGGHPPQSPTRAVFSPDHYIPPHKSSPPPMPNRFAFWQERVLQQHSEMENRDRAKIEEWESTKRCWSGTGHKHVESQELAFPVESLDDTERLGAGAHGVVDKVTYNGVMMARKKIDRERLKHPKTLDELRQEAVMMEKLHHRHIVTLIGTYTFDHTRFLNILTYPVAVCDLEAFLLDFEQLRNAQYVNILDISARIRKLGFADLTPVQYLDPQAHSELLTSMAVRMMEMLGCVTDAMEYVHAQNIKHQDLKPRNILLSPGRVYITDFGISRVLSKPKLSVQSNTTLGYAPPEVVLEEEIPHPSAVDVYSLGAIFLNCVAIPPGFPRERCKEVLSSDHESREDEIEAIASEIASMLMRAGTENESNHTISEKHIMGLIRWMLANDPDERPDMRTVNSQLHMLGGLEQIYHGGCCKRSSGWMAACLNENIRVWEAQSERRFEEARSRFNKSLVDKQQAMEDKEALVKENKRLREEMEGLMERLNGPTKEGGEERRFDNEGKLIEKKDWMEES